MTGITFRLALGEKPDIHKSFHAALCLYISNVHALWTHRFDLKGESVHYFETGGLSSLQLNMLLHSNWHLGFYVDLIYPMSYGKKIQYK